MKGKQHKIDVSALEGHSPGPWRIDGAMVKDALGFGVFRASLWTEDADIRLAAAAPELLARVVELERELEIAIGEIRSLRRSRARRWRYDPF